MTSLFSLELKDLRSPRSPNAFTIDDFLHFGCRAWKSARKWGARTLNADHQLFPKRRLKREGVLYKSTKISLIFVVAIGYETVVGEAPFDISGLFSPNKDLRLETEGRLKRFRTQVLTESLLIFKENNDDRSFNGVPHCAIRQIGHWRFEEGVEFLIEHIDWSIDQNSLPRFKKYPPWIIYPAAIALWDIGGAVVRFRLVQAIEQAEDEDKRKLLSWVLSKLEGLAWATKFIEIELKESNNDLSKERLKKALIYVSKEDGIFSEPFEKAKPAR